MQVKKITICVALAFVPCAFAEEQAAMPEVNVTAERIWPLPSVNNQGLDRDSINRKRSGTSDTAGLLDGQPGVSIYGAGGVSGLPAIHGLADDRLRIKVDGMDLISACGNHMNPPLSYIDPSNVGSIRVFAGITPVSVGGDSIGGAIQVDSHEPEFAADGEGTLLKGQAGVFYRSNGKGKGGNLSATVASETLSMSYNGSTAESQHYKAASAFKAGAYVTNNQYRTGDWLAGDVVGSTSYRARNHSLGMALRDGNHLTELKLGLQDIPYQDYPNQRMDMTGNDSRQVNLRYKGQYQWGALEARAYRESTRHKMQFGEDKQYWYVPMVAPPGSPNPVPGMPMDTEGKNTGAVLKGEIVLTEQDILRVGGEYQRYRLNDWWLPSGGGMWPNTFWNINSGQRDRLDIFGELENRLDEQWISQFGMRVATVKMDTGLVQGYAANATYLADANAFNAANRKRDDTNLDLTMLARYTPDDTSAFEFGLARKARSPNLYERYTWSTGGMAMRMINWTGDGNGYVGNMDLKPEVAHTLSATADWHDAAREEWGFKVTPYYTHIKDYIDASACPVTRGACLAVNPATGFLHLTFTNQNARIYGLDISGYMPLAATESFGNFTMTGVLGYTSGKNTTTGDNLYNMMPLNVKLAAVQKLSGWTNTAEFKAVDAKTRVSRVRNEIKTGGYALLNLYSSYEWQKLRLDFGIENVFNKFYASPLGGAYVGQGATMNTSAVWGIPVPGMGRSINAGVTMKF